MFVGVLTLIACLLTAAAIAIVVYRRLRAEMRRSLERERARIARDLHDELGSGLGSIGILAGIATEPGVDENARRELAGRIASGADDLGTVLTDIVWSLRPDANSVAALAAHLAERGARMFPGEETVLITRLPETWPRAPLSLEARRSLQAIAVEALHNAARHAHARQVEIGVAPAGRRWRLWVEDDGRGMSGMPEDGGARIGGGGRGLANMRRRAEEIGAVVRWTPRPEGGTRMEVEFDSESTWRGRPASEAALAVHTVRPPRRIQTARETAFYGRAAELSRLDALFQGARSGQGRVVLVEGEAGIGKTRLIDEFATRLRRDEVTVRFLYGSYPPGGAATATNAFAHAYREHLGEARLEEMLRDYLSDTPGLVPAFAALLRGSAPPRGVPPLTKDAMHGLFGDLTRALAVEVPTIVVIDDLHFAPEEGRALFAALALGVPGQRVLLVGTMRPEISPAWIAGLARLEHLMQFPVPRLDMESRERLLADAFASNPLPPELVAEIATRSDGNPFFALELIREMRDSGRLTPGPGGMLTARGPADSPLVPTKIRDLIAARLANLPPEDRDLLELASCWGFEFDPKLLGAAAGGDVMSALRCCTRVEREYRLIRQLETTYVFDHHQIQEVLYERLFPPLREQYHAALAGALEERERVAVVDQTVDGRVAVQLCNHFFAGKQEARALGYLDAALEHLGASNAREAGAKLAEQALGVPRLVLGKQRTEVLLHLANNLEMLGRSDEARPALEEALELARADGNRSLQSRIYRLLGINTSRRGRIADEVAEFEHARALAHEAGDVGEEILASRNLALALRVLGRYEESKAISESMLELARREGDQAGEVNALGALGSVLMGLGEHDRALAAHSESLAIAQSLPDRSVELRASFELATTLWGLHRLQEARHQLDRAIALARETGNRVYETYGWIRLGDVSLAAGQYEDAQEYFRKLLGRAEANDQRPEQGAAHFGLLQAHLALGNLATALEHAHQGKAIALERGSKILEEDVCMNSGSLLCQLGNVDESLTSLGHAISLATAAQAALRVANLHWHRGRVHEQAGDPVSARHDYETALDVARDLDEPRLRAPLLADLGGLLATQGLGTEAREHLDTALSIAAEHNVQDARALALAHRARLSGGDAEEAAAALAICEPRIPRWDAMRNHFVLWEAGGERSQLEAAHRILDELVSHAPESYRSAVLAKVALHRRIDEAWRAAQRQGSASQTSLA